MSGEMAAGVAGKPDDEVMVVGRKTLSDGFFPLEEVTIRRHGETGTDETVTREVYRSSRGVAVLPFDPERRTVLLVRQLRVPALLNGDPPFLVEACAGLVEEGDEAAATASREAEEELGYRLRDLRLVCDVYTSPGSNTERLTLFQARYGAGDRVGDGGGLEEEGEEIRILELPLAEAAAMTRNGGIVDAKTVLLLQALTAEA